jgi:hypothetical protein
LIRFSQYIVILFFLAGKCLFPQEIALPANVQMNLILKIINFEKNFIKYQNTPLQITFIYQKDYNHSIGFINEIKSFMADNNIEKISGRKIKIDFIDYSAIEHRFHDKNDAGSIIYIAPLKAVKIDRISQLAKEYKSLTITGIPEYQKYFFSIILDMENQKPLIILNLQSSTAEGAEFNPQFLRLTKVIK